MTVTEVETPVPAQRPAPDSVHAEDWALVERAQAGDLDAFGELYRMHRSTVHRFLHYRVGHRAAEELTADVFARALRSLPSVRYTGNAYPAWLITVARNLANDYFKSARYRLEVSSGGDVYDDDQIDQVVDDEPEREAIRAGLVAAVRRAVAKLPPKQRQVVVLRFLHELSISETAAVVGSNEGAVKALQFRAVHTLRRIAPELEAWR